MLLWDTAAITADMICAERTGSLVHIGAEEEEKEVKQQEFMGEKNKKKN